MRLFIALDIDPQIRHRIATFSDELRQLAPDVKWVKPETFHITLQFLGETKKIEEITAALQTIKALSLKLSFRGAGFFPTPRAPRVLWVGIETGEQLQGLVTSIADALAPLGFNREKGQYKPHLTLARSGSGRPRPVRGERAVSSLQQVRTRIEAMPVPEFGTMTASDFYLYESKLSATGPHYTKLARYRLE